MKRYSKEKKEFLELFHFFKIADLCYPEDVIFKNYKKFKKDIELNKIKIMDGKDVEISKLTEQQKDMLIFFWQEKQDLTRYCEFEALKPIIKKECPQLLKAWNDYLTSIKIMNAVCNSL